MIRAKSRLDVILTFATPSTFHGVAKHAIFAGVQRQRRSAPAEQGAQQELRRRCVIYFRDGVKRAEIARRLGLSRQWVTLVIEVYQTEGFESAVAGKKRGMNEAAAQDRRLLTREEEQKVAGWIIDKNPAQMKFDFALWTARAVRKLIHQALKKDLSMSTV